MQGGAPVIDHPAYSKITLKVVFPPSEAEKVGSLWGCIFKGAASTVQPKVCKDRTTAGPFALRQSRKEAADPGAYMLTVRPCVNVAIGTRRALARRHQHVSQSDRLCPERAGVE